MRINRQNLDLVFRGFQAIYDASFDGTAVHYDKIAMTIPSNSAEENYGWLGQFPELREWVGDRVIHGLSAHGFRIENRKFETTVTVKRDDMSDDRIGIYKPMFSEMGRVTRQHPDRLVLGLLKDGFNIPCYDKESFFSGDHPTGEKGKSISNMQPGDGPEWFLLDTSRSVKPIIWQEREKYEFQSVTDPGHYNVFMKDEYLYGIRARVNCGFGLWQLAFGSKAPLNKENYEAARSAMMDFRGDKGHLLGVMPTLLVVGPKLEAAARTLLMADQIEGTSNIWRSSAELIVTPFVA